MTLTRLGKIIPGKWGGDRFDHPDIKGFAQISGVQFKIKNLRWVPPTDTSDLQDIVEKEIKTILEDITYLDADLFDNVVLGDSKPRWPGFALVNFSVPSEDEFKPVEIGGDLLIPSATGYVTFVFQEELLDDARTRMRKAPQFFIDYLLNNPILMADI